MRDWLAELQALPSERVFVSHHPITPRYNRAETLLAALISTSVVVGYMQDPENANAWLIALWAPHPEGRRRPGFYSCFRILLENDQPFAALLYCFYDGRDDSPKITSITAARAFASHNGFTVHP